MRWIGFYALATMHPEDLPQSKKEENCVALDVNIDFHKWWLVAYQHFGKIIVRPSNLVCLEGQVAHPMVSPRFKQVEANLMAALQKKTIKKGFQKGEEVPVASLFQSINLEESTLPHFEVMKQNLTNTPSGTCESDKLWPWLKLSKTPSQNLPEWEEDCLPITTSSLLWCVATKVLGHKWKKKTVQCVGQFTTTPQSNGPPLQWKELREDSCPFP